jgi:hypothetical protein
MLPHLATPAEPAREAGVPPAPGPWRHRGPSAILCSIISFVALSPCRLVAAKLEFPLLRDMFRTAARGFAASAWRSAESIGQIQSDAVHQTAVNISKAQGIGQRGFIDGKL